MLLAKHIYVRAQILSDKIQNGVDANVCFMLPFDHQMHRFMQLVNFYGVLNPPWHIYL
jgi:hypothetical protein